MTIREIAKSKNPYNQDGCLEEMGKWEGFNIGFARGVIYQHKIDIEKAFNWMMRHVKLHPNDGKSFIKAMEE